MDEILAEFLTETREGLTEIDDGLLRLERDPLDRQALGLVFRKMHTIKGTCGFLGMQRLEKVTHAAETVLGQVRDGALQVTPGRISLLLRAMDTITTIVASLEQTGQEPAGDDAPLIAALEQTVQEGGGELGGSSDPDSDALHDPVAEVSGQDLARAQAEDAALEALWAMAEGPSEPVAQPVVQSGGQPVAQASAAPQSTPASTARGVVPNLQTIRVGVDVLENLMMMVGELVLTRNQLLQMGRSGDISAETFDGTLQRLSTITSELQESVMRTRMQPVGTVWNRLPRLVRELAMDLGKEIDLSMTGADTELDRQVLELITDPLIHMVRNSADHGLESPQQRRAVGKPECGRIMLNAYHEGGTVVIELSDDGRGLDVERIRDKALANGVITSAAVASMTREQIQRLIFRPGFSTADTVTSVSGRGVGMDVVENNIEKIGGTINLISEAGHGTTFVVKIPLTLAIISALVVGAGGQLFAVPQINVAEVVRLPLRGGEASTRVERIGANLILRLRDRLLPLVRLTSLLQIDPCTVPGSDPDNDPDAELDIVVLAAGSNMLALVVDGVFDSEEIVVKPMASILRHLTVFSGNTILGDGSVIMILDPNTLVRDGGGSGQGRPVVRPLAAQTQDDFGSQTTFLLFRAGDQGFKAVPLGLVSRIENFPREVIEESSGHCVVQYRGELMPLMPICGARADGAVQPVLVFSDRDRQVGFMVDEIVDVINQKLEIKLSATTPGVLGVSVLAGQTTDIIDTVYWLHQVRRDWFVDTPGGEQHDEIRLLVIEDSGFFRHILIPALIAAGYHVRAVDSALRALDLRDAGLEFNAIISDVEMPEMNGLEFVRLVRQRHSGEGASWSKLPIVALTGTVTDQSRAVGLAAGFNAYVSKYDLDTLLNVVRECLEDKVSIP